MKEVERTRTTRSVDEGPAEEVVRSVVAVPVGGV